MGKNNNWHSPKENSKSREKMPDSAFLLPSQHKYPWKKKVNGKWVPSASGLRSAISVANSNGDKAVSARASSLLKKYFGN